MMDQIYSGAQFTIIAAVGDAYHGLSGVNGTPRRSQRRLRLETINLELVEIFEPTEHILSSKWASRGWTFQEGCLSARQFVFSNEGLACFCNGMQEWESVEQIDSWDSQHGFQRSLSCGFKSRMRGDFFSGDVLEKILPQITRSDDSGVQICGLLGEYSTRTLGYEADSLNAFLGILSESGCLHDWDMIAQKRMQNHVQTYEFNLGWQSTKRLRRRRKFPTWFWTGWNGPKRFQDFSDSYKVCRIKFRIGGGSTSLNLKRNTAETYASYHLRVSSASPASSSNLS
jgi:hypothetical protein